ncbi:hypothetical protein CK203_093999 [Vitis vinifera]|uniref:Uncharacterized protein n=1 Tax=Vitis vinifera TaxID=29760 RepID=A0A438BRV0_VITVI|nr:hypothetical protein CK203_093999 [Vitis vinifera]
MTSRGVYPPSVIYFEIDRRQGMLNSEMVARALDIPFIPPNPAEFQPITRIEAAEMYSFPTEPDKEKKHHCREVYTVSRWQDTPPRPPAATTPGATSILPNPDTAAHILASLSSTPNIGPSASDGYVHISAEAFNQLLARLDMIQENQANIQLTQWQLVQRVDELTMAVQQWNSSSEKPTSVHDTHPLSIPPTQETNSTTRESTVPTTILTPSEITQSHPSHGLRIGIIKAGKQCFAEIVNELEILMTPMDGEHGVTNGKWNGGGVHNVDEEEEEMQLDQALELN